MAEKKCFAFCILHPSCIGLKPKPKPSQNSAKTVLGAEFSQGGAASPADFWVKT
jgi:hypothetical protein